MADEARRVKFFLADGAEYDGSVTHDDNDGYTLSVDDLPEAAASANLVVERLEARDRTGDHWLFLGVRFRDRAEEITNRGGAIIKTTTTYLSPTTTFFSRHPDNPLSANVHSLGVEVENLDVWFYKSLFDLRRLRNDEDPYGSIDYLTQYIVGNYGFKGFDLVFKLGMDGLDYTRFPREMHLKQVPIIELELPDEEDDVSYLEFVKALRSIERLLGLVFRQPLRTVKVYVKSQAYAYAWELFPYRIILSDVRPSSPQVTYREDLSFTHDEIGEFQALLDKWSELEKQIEPIVDLFLSSVSGTSGVLENIFLNRIQGIEGFHRAFRGGRREDPTVYDARKQRLLEGIQGDDQSLLKRVLKFGNDLSLARRLHILDEELRAKDIKTITVCDLDSVAHTRNYYSHYEVDITPVPREQLTELTHQAGQMLFALILTELGIDADVVSRAIERLAVFNPL